MPATGTIAMRQEHCLAIGATLETVERDE